MLMSFFLLQKENLQMTEDSVIPFINLNGNGGGKRMLIPVQLMYLPDIIVKLQPGNSLQKMEKAPLSLM